MISRLAILKVNIADLYGFAGGGYGTLHIGNLGAPQIHSIKLQYHDCVNKSSPPPKAGELVFIESVHVDYSMFSPNKTTILFRTKDNYKVEIECVDYEPLFDFIPETPAALVLFT